MKPHYICYLLFAVTLLGFSVPNTAAYATQNAVATDSQFSMDEPSESVFSYDLEGRPDPFAPFISQKATTSKSPLDPNEIVEEENVLTGMQLFEPGQLTLVAVLMTEKAPVAMVEDVTGTGYVLREGMLIGRRGTVSKILPTAVNITEKAKTRAGKEVLSTVTMKLNKEGDE